jgi:hypothetical protein
MQTIPKRVLNNFGAAPRVRFSGSPEPHGAARAARRRNMMKRSVFSFLAALAVCGCGAESSTISSALSSAATSTSGDGGTRGAPSAEDIAACADKAVGDACTDIYDGGDPGTCQLAADGTTLACSEQHRDGGRDCGP